MRRVGKRKEECRGHLQLSPKNKCACFVSHCSNAAKTIIIPDSVNIESIKPWENKSNVLSPKTSALNVSASSASTKSVHETCCLHGNKSYFFIALLLLVKYKKAYFFLSVQEISRGSYQGHKRNRNKEKS